MASTLDCDKIYGETLRNAEAATSAATKAAAAQGFRSDSDESPLLSELEHQWKAWKAWEQADVTDEMAQAFANRLEAVKKAAEHFLTVVSPTAEPAVEPVDLSLAAAKEAAAEARAAAERAENAVRRLEEAARDKSGS